MSGEPPKRDLDALAREVEALRRVVVAQGGTIWALLTLLRQAGSLSPEQFQLLSLSLTGAPGLAARKRAHGEGGSPCSTAEGR